MTSPKKLGYQLLDILENSSHEDAIEFITKHPIGIDMSVVGTIYHYTPLSMVCSKSSNGQSMPFVELMQLLMNYPRMDLNQRVLCAIWEFALDSACFTHNDSLRLLLKDARCNLYKGTESIVMKTLIGVNFQFSSLLASMRDLGNNKGKSHREVIHLMRARLVRWITEGNVYESSLYTDAIWGDTPYNKLMELDFYLHSPLSAVVKFRKRTVHFGGRWELLSTYLIILIIMLQDGYYTLMDMGPRTRFFKIMLELPMELQCTVCNMFYMTSDLPTELRCTRNRGGFIVHGINEMLTFMKINKMF
jgi:hypothetical protein